MARIDEARQTCEEIINKLYSDKHEYTKFLKFSGHLFRMHSASSMQIFAQNPNAKMISTYSGWQKINRHVNYKQRSLTILGSDGTLKHYFDVNQTGGNAVPSLWKIDRNSSTELVKALSSELASKQKNISECIDALAEKYVKSNAAQVVKELDIPTEHREEFLNSYLSMVKCVIISRCSSNSEYKYRGNDDYIPDLKAVDLCKNKTDFMRMSEYVQSSARSAILSIEHNMVSIINKRRSENYGTERNLQDSGRDEDVLLRTSEGISSGNRGGQGNRDNISTGPGNLDLQPNARGGNQSRGEGTSEPSDRDLRTEVAEVYGGKLPAEAPGITNEPSLGADTEDYRQRSRRNADNVGEELHGNISDSNELLGEGSILQNNAAGELKYNNEGVSPSAERITDTEAASTGAASSFEPEQITFLDEGTIFTVTTSNRPAITQDMIDYVLRSGGNNSNSLERIVAQFQKAKTAAENAAFLRNEYDINDGKGVLYPSETGTLAQLATWFTEDGITFAPGDTVNNAVKTTISWEEAAEHIEKMLENGNYCSQALIHRASEYDLETIAEEIWYLHQDCEVEYFIPDEMFKGGFSDSTDRIRKTLSDPELLQTYINGLTNLIEQYNENRNILRYHFHNPEDLLTRLKDLQGEHREFTANDNFYYEPRFFITDDEKDGALLRSEKFSIYDFFKKEPTPELKEKVNFLKQHYGTGGYYGGGISYDYNSKGFEYRKGTITEPDAAATMKWSEVANRITKMINRDTYITKSDIDKRVNMLLRQLNGQPNYSRNETLIKDWSFLDTNGALNSKVVLLESPKSENNNIISNADTPELSNYRLYNEDGEYTLRGDVNINGQFTEGAVIANFNERANVTEYLSEHNLRITQIIDREEPIQNIEYNGIMPDENLTLNDMVEYGYSYTTNQMLPLSKERAKELSENGAGVFRIYEDDTEGYVENWSDYEEEHNGLYGIEASEWERYQNIDKTKKASENKAESLSDYSAVYKQSYSYAFEHEETAEFMASHKLNMDCRFDIQATADIYDSVNNLDNFIKDLTEKYGTERPLYVLSRTVQQANDNRYSPEVIQIAENYIFPDTEDQYHAFSPQYVMTDIKPSTINALVPRLYALQNQLEISNGEDIPSAEQEKLHNIQQDTATPTNKVTITCEWSESNAFEGGKTYSVAEFDRIMETADTERIAGQKSAIEKYGSTEAWYNSDVVDEFTQYYGYDKTKFTVNLPNGASITERQDIGDGYGGVIDYFRSFESLQQYVPILEAQRDMDNAISERDELQVIHSEMEKERSSADTTVLMSNGVDVVSKAVDTSKDLTVSVTADNEALAELRNQLLSNGYSIRWNNDGLSFSTDTEQIDYIKAFLNEKNIEFTLRESQKSKDFIITSDEQTIGAKAKYCENVAAIKLLNELELDNRQATPEEQEILAKYSGWGGIPEAFDKNNSSWADEYIELYTLLSPEEYESARASTLNAHYTSPIIIEAMYNALENFGFKGGNVLEPAMGTGNFLGKMPIEMRENTHFTGVELDSISGRIAKQLYPNADISITGFEKKTIANNTFDVAIGNVPFGNYGLSDPEYNKHNFLIHDYFFAKSLDKVAPGGVVAFITSKGTLDKQGTAFREYLADRADLIGAIRLPNNAFKAAGTEVTSDIIFLKKREQPPIEKPDWVFTAENADGIPINQYFINHPELILGKMEMKSGRFGMEATCSPAENADLKEQLRNAVANLNAQIIIDKRHQKEQEVKGIIPATADVRNFTFTSIDDKIYFRVNDEMNEVKVSPQQLGRMQGLITIRENLRELINAQAEGCSDEALAEYQSTLNQIYDDFVEKYGFINDVNNTKAFSEDDDYNLLRALEDVNPETKEISKSEIFTRRTIKAEVIVTHADTPEEALQISMDLKGRVDISYMSELTGIDKDRIVSELSENELIFLNPAKISDNSDIYEAYEENSEYLSGNIRDKLDEVAFQEIKYMDEPDMLAVLQRNKAALEKALPPIIQAGDIKADIGVSWVEPQDYERFIAEHTGLNRHAVSRWCPLRRTISGEYKISNKNNFNAHIGVTSKAGTERINAFKIFENLLNKRDVVVRDRIWEHGEEKLVINKKETDLAQEKARQMKEAFSKWVFSDPERREKYVEKYNRLFNSIKGRHYDGSKQTFPGMSPDIELKPHQKDAIARAKLGGNTLLAHCVGAGKSFEMFASAMERKRLGLINKACVVVPKHLVGQTAIEWQRLYPNAHLLTATEKDFSKDNRQKFIGRCVTGNYDAVIMSYEQFEKIPMSTEYKCSFIEREIEDIVQGINEARSTRDNITVKDLERQKKSAEKRLNKLIETSKTKDTSLNFEQLGFDYLVVDEAHNYKNGLVITKMSNVAGVQSTPAQKSEDILMKCQYLNEKTGYKGILFATGTPVSNSMTEFYTMQRYLRPDLLEKAQLYTFDDWASNFGEVVSQLELKPAGDGFRTKKRFAKFNNLPELMQMYREFADIRTADMLKLPVPNIIGGKPQTIVAKPDEFQKAYIQELAERSEYIMSGNVDPRVDNMLKITHEARLLGLDARAVNPEAENRPDSKVNLCIDNIMKIYEDTTEEKGVQIIFCDIAVHGDEEQGKWSVYDNIKDELIKRGMPEKEICFAGDAKNQKERNEMYAQLRNGTKRLVISSTQKMGTGANVQTRLAALHHLDIPWKPSDLEQQNGRILRQGNQFSDVGIYHYVTEGTFDAYMLSILTTKQRFISQTMSGEAPGRSCSDVDEMVLNYSEMQAIASGDPRIKEKIELDGEVAKLRLLESEYYNEIYKMQDKIPQYKASLEYETALLSRCEIDLANRDIALKSMSSDEFAGIKIEGIVFKERREAGVAMRPFIQKVMNNQTESCTIGEYGGFMIGIEKMKSIDQHARLFITGASGVKYFTTDVELASDTGNVQRIENLFKTAIEKKIEITKANIETDTQNIQEAFSALERPFERAEELAVKSARLEQLNKELNVDKADEQFINGDDEIDESNQDRELKKANPKR